MIAFYMRLSDEDTCEGESCSIQNQRDLLYDFVRMHREFLGCKIVEFCDDGYSGMNFCRPGVQKLLSLAGNTITCIMVKDFSRFGRNLIEVGNYLDQVFPLLGVRFIAVNENYDSGKSRGSSVGLEVSLKAMIGEMYSRDISEKIRCVQRVKMQRGEYLCAIAFYGYRRSQTEKNKLVIDEPAAEVVRRIFSMAAEGISAVEIASRLNRDKIASPLMYRRENNTDKIRGWNTAGTITYWTQESVRRILSDERYTGCLISGKRRTDLLTKETKAVHKSEWIVVENTQEAIVSKELFGQVQRKELYEKNFGLDKKSGLNKRQKRRGYSFFQCAYCGRTLQRSRGKEAYFFCPTKKTVSDIFCKDIRIMERDLERVLFCSFRMQVQWKGQFVFREKQRVEKELQRAEKRYQMERKRYKTLQMVIFEEYAKGHILQQEYLTRKKEAEKQQKELERQYDELEKWYRELLKRVVLLQSDGMDWGGEIGNEQKRELLKELVQTVWVSKSDRIEIVWKFRE